jgi:hypothetical protein
MAAQGEILLLGLNLYASPTSIVFRIQRGRERAEEPCQCVSEGISCDVELGCLSSRDPHEVMQEQGERGDNDERSTHSRATCC